MSERADLIRLLKHEISAANSFGIKTLTVDASSTILQDVLQDFSAAGFTVELGTNTHRISWFAPK